MRTQIYMVLVGCAVLSTAASAEAAVEHLQGGVVNKLEDQDFETLVNYNATTDTYSFFNPNPAAGDDPILSVGDILTGVFRIQAVLTDDGTLTFGDQHGPSYSNNPPPTPAFTGVFVTQVTDKDPVTGGYTFELGAAPDAAWTFLGLTRNDSDTVIRMFDDSTNPFITQSSPTLTLASLQAALATANGSLLWEFGFTGANTLWTAFTSSDNVLLVSPTNGNFQAGVNVTSQGAGPELVPHNILAALGFTTAGPTQLQLRGGFESISALSVLPVQTDTDLYIQPVPEAMSVLIWAGLISLSSLFAARRRR